jgi:hypothetical protein
MVDVLPFEFAQEALDAGFAEGTEDRQKGVQPEDFARELREPFKWRRSPGSRFYDDWRRGYEAGYRGLQKRVAWMER